MIGAVIFIEDKDCAVLDEMYLSCRVLGQGTDDIIIFEAVKTEMNKLGAKRFCLNFLKKGRSSF